MIVPIKAVIVSEMGFALASDETLVNPTAEGLDVLNTLRVDEIEPSNNPSESVTAPNREPIRQHILRRTRALKQFARRKLESTKNGLVRVAKKVVGRA
ncbi:hypothetical protein QCA50_017738 [Cerrena zonata]|uniref:Uncharacterized protein n=1 Tax=Cerrena zonata TaxID=2478898 RepID=A0AAW0F846_9APHY